MREERFEVRVGDGSLLGCAAAEGAPPALLLHGGPAIPDYMGSCALEPHRIKYKPLVRA